MGCIKIKDARTRKNKVFQEYQGIFYIKTQGKKQLKKKVRKGKTWKILGRHLERQPRKPTTDMDGHSCEENRPNSYECARIHNHRKVVMQNGQETK